MTTGLGANRFSQLESRDDYKAFYDEQGNHYGNHHITADFPRAAFILERVGDGDIVLEMGCQTGGITKLLSPRVKTVVANDVSDTYRARALEVLAGCPNVMLVPGFAEDLANGVFRGQCSMVIAMELLEHVADPDAICVAVKACMAPGGTALFSVPKGYTDALGEHVREFTRESFSDLLSSHFRIVEITDGGEWYLAEAWA